jgi:hypothetical protein
MELNERLKTDAGLLLRKVKPLLQPVHCTF